VKRNIAIIVLFGLMSKGYAGVGLVGGIAGDLSAYAALVDLPSGSVTPISGLPANSMIFSVAQNASGNGIIGGSEGSNGYAALIDATGNLIPLTISVPNGSIFSVSINQNGQAFIGGQANSNQTYFASVSPDGSVTPLILSMATRNISAVAINEQGAGLIGGQGAQFKAYASYISQNGTETALVGFGVNAGSYIGSVAINAQGNGIIGGSIFDTAYGVLTSQDQITATLSPLPSAFSSLSSVAINDASLGLIGGSDDLSNPFAGYVDVNGTVTPLSLDTLSGNIVSVALNASGQGIIGGVSNSNVYAALVNPLGIVTSLIQSPPSGMINGVAIDDTGIGLFGGQINGNQGYAALVAPNGALTFLDMSAENTLNSVALENALSELVTAITPKSIGFLNGVFFTQLAASSALENRFIEQNKVWKKRPGQTDVAQNASANSHELLASNSNDFVSLSKNLNGTFSSSDQTKNSIWIAPFGDLLQLKGEGSFPRIRNTIGGILLAYDRQGEHFLLGSALGYAFNYLHYANKQGHGKIHEEMASVYGSYYSDHFWLGAAIWGGYYHFTNLRHASSMITSRGKMHGWVLAPHVEVATPWAMDRQSLCFVEPFISLDWIKDWQHGFTESGSSGFNLKMKSLHGSLLQSEAGLRFYERFIYGWGDFLLEEKISYVNQHPFFDKKVTTTFVSSAVGFPIAIGSTQVENLGCLGLMATFEPIKKSYPFGGVETQVTLNGSYQSYFISFFTGWNF
jgi:hypothetical protein